MSETAIIEIKEYLEEKKFPIYGVADAEKLNNLAPEGFRPKDMMPNAKAVLLIARPLPLSIFQTPINNGNYSFYTSSFHTYYQVTNDIVNRVCLMIEEKGFDALPIPSYSPLKFHNGEPRGLVSLKHFAVQAGLGKMGKNSLLIHPKAGNVLRLGGLITTMDWPADGERDFPRLCPDTCDKCRKACPVGALTDDGVNKMKCLANCIEHVMVPPKRAASLLRWAISRSRFLTRQMELFTLSFFENYGISCFECLTACPHFPGNRKK